MTIYALVNSDGTVVNRIVLDNLQDWAPPLGHSLHDAPFEIGGVYKNGVYAAPAPTGQPTQIFDPIDTWDVISLKIAFNHENRIRALEGKAAITIAQFKIAVKAQL